MSKLTVSPSPHIHGGQSVGKLMYGVVIAMLPALGFSIFYYGISAIYLTLISILSCMAFEFLIQKYVLKTKVSVLDGSAIVTGMLLAFNLPSGLPPFIIVLGAFVAIVIGKMTFGGLGNNPFNPALLGRVFLLISFPTRMTKFVSDEFKNKLIVPIQDLSLDGVTSATPLTVIKEGFKNGESLSSIMHEQGLSINKMFMGDIGGSIGEMAALALILGLIYMLVKKIISWHIPVSILATVFVFMGILWLFSVEGSGILLQNLGIKLPVIDFLDADGNTQLFHMASPVFHILTGGLLLGAIFMATDYVTSPMVPKAMIIYGVGIGLITSLIRVFGSYPEGISFAILIMNGFTPLLNMYIKPKRFGKVTN